MHVVGGVRKDQQKYGYQGTTIDAQGLLAR